MGIAMTSAQFARLFLLLGLLLLLQSGCTTKLQPMISSLSFSTSGSKKTESDDASTAGAVPLSDATPADDRAGQSVKNGASANDGAITLVNNEANPQASALRQTNERTPGLSIISRRAMVTIRYAEDLAKRGAVYSAEDEFIQALKLIAHAYDTQAEETVHIPALHAGLTALKEADDFAQQGLPVAIETDLSRFVVTHKTPVLQDANLKEITPLKALQMYYAFAEHELAFAGGTDPAASQSFYGLARLQNMYPKESKKRHGTGPAKAIALHRTALRIDNNNYKAANELGVLLAKAGHFENAKDCLLQSIAISPQPESWKNLARVCEELGNQQQAQTAWNSYEQVKTRRSTNHPSIRWVGFEDFHDPNDASWQGLSTTYRSDSDQPDSESAVRQATPNQLTKPNATSENKSGGFSSLINFAKEKAGQLSGRNNQQ